MSGKRVKECRNCNYKKKCNGQVTEVDKFGQESQRCPGWIKFLKK